MNVTFTRPGSSYLVTVKNDAQGREFIKGLREHYRNWCQTIRLRGRGHRYGHGNMTKANKGDNRYQASIPLSKASHIAIYLG